MRRLVFVLRLLPLLLTAPLTWACSDLNHLTGVRTPPMCDYPTRVSVDTFMTYTYHTPQGDTVLVGPRSGGYWWYTLTTTFPAGKYPCAAP